MLQARPDWTHEITEWFAIALTFVLFMWGKSIQDRKDADKRRDEARADTERRHQENQRLLNEVVTENKYFPAHGHDEEEGPLTADGLHYPPGKHPRRGQ